MLFEGLSLFIGLTLRTSQHLTLPARTSAPLHFMFLKDSEASRETGVGFRRMCAPGTPGLLRTEMRFDNKKNNNESLDNFRQRSSPTDQRENKKIKKNKKEQMFPWSGEAMFPS